MKPSPWLCLLLPALCACSSTTSAPNYAATASAAQGNATAVADIAAAQMAQAQQARQSEIDAMNLEAERRRATLQAGVDLATLLALTPTLTRTYTPSPVPTSTPAPTWTPTPDVTATARAALLADTATFGGIGFGIMLGVIVLGGVAVLFGATANRIEAQAKAEQIRARADARAKEILANAEAERMRHWQVGGNIVSTTEGGVQIVAMNGGRPPEGSQLAPMPTFRRMTNGGKRVDDVIRLTPLSQQAVDYLRECAELVGWDAQRLPSASETGSNGDRQPVIDALKAANLAYTQRGHKVGGSYLIGEYETIRDLHDALLAGVVVLKSPSVQTT